MLVKLIDIKGQEIWVNPVYVKAVRPSKKGVTEVFISFGSQWAAQTSVKVKANADEVAEAISAAMPISMIEAAAASEQAQDEAEATQRAATVAATSG